MFANTPKELACAKAIHTITVYFQQISTDPSISIDHKMRMLQWVYKKIPEINKLLIAIKTEQVNRK